ncbi:MAG: hypothetical protein ABJF04_01940 [Reichenbachiella sp.]|uniref:hypothetical protein n=1 Tax=Reichenbachiella sp. TaxID=2184521 RepID=UPI003262D368
MNFKKYFHNLLDLPTNDLDEYVVTRGIGYEVLHLKKLWTIKVKCYGSVDVGLIEHIREQVHLYAMNQTIRYILLDFNRPIQLDGLQLSIRSGIDQRFKFIKSTIVLLPDWSHKKSYIRFLNLVGLYNVHFFFSLAGAFNWITAHNSAKS